MLRFLAHAHLADLAPALPAVLQRASALFWLQMSVVVVGLMWCLAIASTLFFGGWYAYRHPLTGNDRVLLRVARVLSLLTLGLTEYPPPQLDDEGREDRFNAWSAADE